MPNLPANKRISGATKAVSSLTHHPAPLAPLGADPPLAPRKQPAKAKQGRDLGNDITALIITLLGVMIFLSLMSYDPSPVPGAGGNWMGSFGTHVAGILLHLIGLGAFLLAGVLTSIGALLLVGVHVEMKPSEFVGQMFFVAGGAICFHLLMPGDKVLGHMPGGAVGAMGGEVGRSFFGDVGVWLVAGMAAGGGLLLAADTSIGNVIERTFRASRALFAKRSAVSGVFSNVSAKLSPATNANPQAHPNNAQSTAKEKQNPASPNTQASASVPSRLQALSTQLRNGWLRLRGRPDLAEDFDDDLPQDPQDPTDTPTPKPSATPAFIAAPASTRAPKPSQQPPAPPVEQQQKPSAAAPQSASTQEDTLPPVSASFDTARNRVASILAKLPTATHATAHTATVNASKSPSPSPASSPAQSTAAATPQQPHNPLASWNPSARPSNNKARASASPKNPHPRSPSAPESRPSA